MLLWRYPDTQRQPLLVGTEHTGNIFGVRFLPQTGDTALVTGAMDFTVQVGRWVLLCGCKVCWDDDDDFLVSVSGLRTSGSDALASFACCCHCAAAVPQLHRLDAAPASRALPLRSHSGGRGGGDASVSPPAESRTTVYRCHHGRVKDVAVEPLNPHLFWSAAEDGLVRQFDTRLP